MDNKINSFVGTKYQKQTKTVKLIPYYNFLITSLYIITDRLLINGLLFFSISLVYFRKLIFDQSTR